MVDLDEEALAGTKVTVDLDKDELAGTFVKVDLNAVIEEELPGDGTTVNPSVAEVFTCRLWHVFM